MVRETQPLSELNGGTFRVASRRPYEPVVAYYEQYWHHKYGHLPEQQGEPEILRRSWGHRFPASRFLT